MRIGKPCLDSAHCQSSWLVLPPIGTLTLFVNVIISVKFCQEKISLVGYPCAVRQFGRYDFSAGLTRLIPSITKDVFMVLVSYHGMTELSIVLCTLCMSLTVAQPKVALG